MRVCIEGWEEGGGVKVFLLLFPFPDSMVISYSFTIPSPLFCFVVVVVLMI